MSISSSVGVKMISSPQDLRTSVASSPFGLNFVLQGRMLFLDLQAVESGHLGVKKWGRLISVGQHRLLFLLSRLKLDHRLVDAIGGTALE